MAIWTRAVPLLGALHPARPSRTSVKARHYPEVQDSRVRRHQRRTISGAQNRSPSGQAGMGSGLSRPVLTVNLIHRRGEPRGVGNGVFLDSVGIIGSWDQDHRIPCYKLNASPHGSSLAGS
jgi:hypothetical protein